MIQINKIDSPFIYYCQKVIPLAFDESLSYYEVLCNLLAKIKEVIDEQNRQGEGIIELQNKYIELKNYVDTYFDNLDLQSEVDAKLDEMAESGELADIIAQYLGLAGVLAFDTIADLESATNVVNGSICLVIGDETYNDGKSAYYKVRNLTIDDTIDGFNIVGISETLVGERLPNYYINSINSQITTINQKIAKKHMVIIGDSFSTTTYNPANTAWYTIVAQRLNLTPHNYSKDSAGYSHVGAGSKTFNLEVNDAIADTSYNNEDVDLVIVYGGLNDMNSTDIQTYTNNARTTFTNIINNFPNAKVICMGINTWAGGLYIGTSNNTTLNYFNTLKQNLADLGVIFVNSTLWLLLDSDNCYDPITTHPNEMGNKITATNLLNTMYGTDFVTSKNAYQITQSTFTNGSGTVHVRFHNNLLILEGSATTDSNGIAIFTMPKNLSSNTS